jgi:hypothetical protein
MKDNLADVTVVLVKYNIHLDDLVITKVQSVVDGEGPTC